MVSSTAAKSLAISLVLFGSASIPSATSLTCQCFQGSLVVLFLFCPHYLSTKCNQ